MNFDRMIIFSKNNSNKYKKLTYSISIVFVIIKNFVRFDSKCVEIQVNCSLFQLNPSAYKTYTTALLWVANTIAVLNTLILRSRVSIACHYSVRSHFKGLHLPLHIIVVGDVFHKMWFSLSVATFYNIVSLLLSQLDVRGTSKFVRWHHNVKVIHKIILSLAIKKNYESTESCKQNAHFTRAREADWKSYFGFRIEIFI